VGLDQVPQRMSALSLLGVLAVGSPAQRAFAFERCEAVKGTGMLTVNDAPIDGSIHFDTAEVV